MYSMQILRFNERLNFVLPIILNDFNNLTFKALRESTYFSTRHVAHEVGLLDSGHRIEYLLLEDAVAGIGVDGEIAYAERGEVLEEVGALGGIDMVVLQT